jgi:hypothetical protein
VHTYLGGDITSGIVGRVNFDRVALFLDGYTEIRSVRSLLSLGALFVSVLILDLVKIVTWAWNVTGGHVNGVVSMPANPSTVLDVGLASRHS